MTLRHEEQNAMLLHSKPYLEKRIFFSNFYGAKQIEGEEEDTYVVRTLLLPYSISLISFNPLKGGPEFSPRKAAFACVSLKLETSCYSCFFARIFLCSLLSPRVCLYTLPGIDLTQLFLKTEIVGKEGVSKQV